MGEAITDPLILQQIEAQQAKLGGARGEPITDPMILQQIRKQQGGATGAETAYDVARQGVGGVSQGITNTLMAPLNLSAWLTGTQGKGLQGLGEKALSPWLNQPEAETTPGRYAHATGEAIGSTAVPSGGILRAASKLPAVAPAIPGLAERFLRPIAEQPGAALGIDVASATGAGAAQQGAQDVGLPPIAQGIAGLAGGFAAPLGAVGTLRGYQGLRSIADPAGDTGAFRLPTREAPTPGALNPKIETRAYQIIADKAQEAGITADELQHRLDTGTWSRDFYTGSHAPNATVLADLDEAFARLAGSAVRQHAEAANVVRPIVTARQTGITPDNPLQAQTVREAGIPTAARYDKDAPPTGQQGRLAEAHRRALNIYDEEYHGHGETAADTAEMITAGQKANSKPAYEAVHAAGEPVDLRQDPGVSAVLKKWQDRAAHPDTPSSERRIIEGALKEFAPSGQVAKNIEHFDRAKRFVDEDIKPYFEGIGDKKNREMGAMLVQLKNDFVKAVDKIETENLGKLYEKARSIYSSDAESKAQIKLGQDIYSGKADIKSYNAMTDPEARKRVRLGYHSAFEENTGSKAANVDRTRMMSSPQRQKELANLIERTETPVRKEPVRQFNKETGEWELAPYADRPQRFGGYVGGEEAMIRTRDIVKGGSPTAERLADDAAFDTLHSLAEAVKGQPLSRAMQRSVEYTLQRLFGERADVAASVARKLFSADPEVQRRVIAELRLRMGQSRFARFTQLMAENQRRAVNGQLGGAASGLSQEQQ